MQRVNICMVKTIKFSNWLLTGISMRLVRWTGKSSQVIHPKHLLKETPEWIKYFSKEDRVLDIGCHNGQRDFRLSPFVEKIVAFDYDKKAIQNAKKWQEKNNFENIEFLELSAEDKLPFDNDSFNKILFLDVIEHLNNREIVLKECFRILKNGGTMILTAPNKETPWKKFQKNLGLSYYSDTDHKIEYSEVELKDAISITGFNVESVNPIVYDFPLVGLIDIIGGLNLNLYGKLQNWKKLVAQKYPEKSIGFIMISKK